MNLPKKMNKKKKEMLLLKAKVLLNVDLNTAVKLIVNLVSGV